MVYRKKRMTKKRTGKSKRGFSASANLGAFGKYSVSYNKRSLSSAVKDVMRAEEAPQHFVQPATTNTTGLLQNTIYTWNPTVGLPWGPISSGTTSEVFRESEVIRIEYLKLNMIFNTNSLSTFEHTYRIAFVKSRNQYNVGFIGSGFGLSDIFLGGTGLAVTALGVFDKRKVTVLYDTTVHCIPRVSGQILNCFKEMTIPIHADFEYAPASPYSKTTNYYLIVIPFIPNGTTGTTSVGGVSIDADLCFKNCK